MFNNETEKNPSNWCFRHSMLHQGQLYHRYFNLLFKKYLHHGRFMIKILVLIELMFTAENIDQHIFALLVYAYYSTINDVTPWT